MISRILVEVKEIEKDNKPCLCFIYQDKSEKNYEIFDDEGENERYIKKLGFSKQQEKHYLIENNPSIQSRTESGDFRYCIFLMQADFLGATFTKKADFWGATFTEQANFEHATFTEQADFGHATFTKKTNFLSAKFTKQADFWGATFTEQADFLGATFTKKAGFEEVEFTKRANFWGATFTEQANFRGATFSQYFINFEQAQFSTALNLHGVESINLNLDQSQLDKIYYDTDCKFSSKNRDTFTILKSIALKQHDKIKALEFHTQEYNQYYKKLSWSNWRDVLFYGKFILWFERGASYFGTSIVLPILWYFGFAVLFYWFMNRYDVIDTKTIITETFINFIIPTNIEVGDFFINNCYSLSSLDYVLFVIYKILQITLLYEIIKTFRQYSRNL